VTKEAAQEETAVKALALAPAKRLPLVQAQAQAEAEAGQQESRGPTRQALSPFTKPKAEAVARRDR